MVGIYIGFIGTIFCIGCCIEFDLLESIWIIIFGCIEEFIGWIIGTAGFVVDLLLFGLILLYVSCYVNYYYQNID